MPIPVYAPPPISPFFGDFSGSINGLPIGGGTPYKVVGITGWFTMQASPLGGAASPSPRPYTNSSWSMPYFSPERVVTLLLDIETTPGLMPAATEALNAATLPGVQGVPVTLQVGGISTTAYGSVSMRDVPTELSFPIGYAQATVEVTCEDSRRFGSDLTATTALPSSTGGLTWPISWPLGWNSTQVTGQVALTNPGNTSGPVKLRIDGPLTAPVVTHVGSGKQLTFASDLIVHAGDFLLIDNEARTVLYNGQASRNGSVVSRGWFGFDPGVNTFAFNADTYDASALLTVTGTPTWI